MLDLNIFYGATDVRVLTRNDPIILFYYFFIDFKNKSEKYVDQCLIKFTDRKNFRLGLKDLSRQIKFN